MGEIGIQFLLLVVMAASPAITFAANRSGSLITINVPVVYMARYVRNGFKVCKIHYERHQKGGALKIATFLGPEMATSKASAIWAQKVEISKAHSFQCPE
jgi:hypothetical protein